MPDNLPVKKKSTGRVCKRKSLYAPDDAIGKIEYNLAKALGALKYSRPVSRNYAKGSYNFGGEVVFIKVGDDDKTIFISPDVDDDDTYITINQFVKEQQERFNKNGAPPVEIEPPQPTEEEKQPIAVSWYDIQKMESEERREKMKAGFCGKHKIFRNGNMIIPIDASFWDTCFSGMITIVKATAGAN